MNKISLRGVTKVFGKQPERALDLLARGMTRDEILRKEKLLIAVHDVSFDIEEGELFVVMGLSGSGKSTLVRMINRLHDPTSGSVEVDGEDVTRMSASQLRELRMTKISMVFQHFALFPHRRVWENAAYGLQVRGVDAAERRRRAMEALEIVGLTNFADAFPHELSGGMKQRVGLARGLATDADVLLMDEPFSALDPLIRRDMQNLLLDLQRDLKRTIVFITHDLNEAMRVGDRIAVMRDGAVVQVGTGGEIIAEPANEYVADFISDVDRSRCLTAEQVMKKPLLTASPDDDLRDLLNKLSELEQNALYVLDPAGRILGVAKDHRIAQAISQGKTRVRDVLIREHAEVHPSTRLINLSRLAAQDRVPIAVVDDERRLLGVVPRATLLAAIAGEEEAADAT